jgi:hypothetical protein
VDELEEVKLMFGFTQTTGGLYFGPVANDINIARDLKKATAEVLNLSKEKQSLVTAKQWFCANFA